MAIQMSMQDSEMEDSDATRPTTSATDATGASPMPMDTDQVICDCINYGSMNYDCITSDCINLLLH